MSNQEETSRCSIFFLWLLITTLGITGCSGAIRDLQSQRTEGFFLPPTAAVVATHPSMLTPTSILIDETPTADFRPSPTPQCTDNLLFVEDLTIPDGSVFVPGSTLDKRWQVENNGTCNWDERYRMKLIAGSDLGASPEQALYPARGGTQTIIRILFNAPIEPGTHLSAWQAFTPQGQPFGDPFYLEIAVENPQ